MLKKMGLGSVVLGIALMIIGIWLADSSSPFDYWEYSSGTRTVMEFFPWFLSALGAFGLIGGIFYLIQSMKPLVKQQAKIIEKNATQVTLEYQNGSREKLTLIGNTAIVPGDVGIVGIQGKFIVEFKKQD